MKKVEFTPVPGTRGRISANGVELVVTHGDFPALRRLCTVTNKSAQYQLKKAYAALAFFEGKLQATNAAMGSGSQSAGNLEDKVDLKRAEIEKLKGEVKKEYWADEDDCLSLPAGFWWMCETIEGNTHLNTEVEYSEIPVVDNKKPREYQVEVTEALLKYKRASCVMPTGTGKSLMIAMAAWSLVKAGKRVCVIEPTIELVDQTYQFLKKYFTNCAALGGSFKFKAGCQVLVSTIDSAMKHIDIFDAVLVDEFHHSAANTYNDTLFMALNGKYFYGFTACSTRADGMSLGIHAACGPVVYEKDTRWAIENGFLVNPKILMLEIGGLGTWNPKAPHVSAYKGLMRNPKVMKIIFDMVGKSVAKNKKIMMLYKTVMAGQEAVKYGKKSGGTAFDVASAQYRNPLREFRNNKLDLLVSNSALCAEGIDVPSIDVLINCCQVSSENMVRQILGRGLRTSPGKTELIYIDIVTTGFMPFERAAASRLKIYEEITDDVKIVRL